MMHVGRMFRQPSVLPCRQKYGTRLIFSVKRDKCSQRWVQLGPPVRNSERAEGGASDVRRTRPRYGLREGKVRNSPPASRSCCEETGVALDRLVSRLVACMGSTELRVSASYLRLGPTPWVSTYVLDIDAEASTGVTVTSAGFSAALSDSVALSGTTSSAAGVSALACEARSYIMPPW